MANGSEGIEASALAVERWTRRRPEASPSAAAAAAAVDCRGRAPVARQRPHGRQPSAPTRTSSLSTVNRTRRLAFVFISLSLSLSFSLSLSVALFLVFGSRSLLFRSGSARLSGVTTVFFTGFYRVFLFLGFFLVLPYSCRVLLGFSWFSIVLPRFTGFYLVLPSFT